MAEPLFSGEDIDRMKADAIRRARQMHSRAASFSPSNRENSSSAENSGKKKSDESQKSDTSPRGKKADTGDILALIKMLGIDSDLLIVMVLVLMLSKEEDCLPLIMALLYIAM